MSKIHELYEKISLNMDSKPQLERTVVSEIGKIVQKAFTQMMSSDEGFCFKFNLPLKSVNNLYKVLGVDTKEVFEAFRSDWGDNTMRNRMHSDPYYQILLLLLYYGIKENKDYIKTNSLLIVSFKLWNGRKGKFFPKFCDKNIMKYVTTHMVTNRHTFGKYDDPLDMLSNWLVPTLLKKYESEVRRDPIKIKRMFEQAHSRIRQLFVHSNRIDIKTGEAVSQGGILNLYMKAKQDGKSITNPSVKSFDDQSPSHDDYTTSSNRDEIINTTTDFITMSPNPQYSDNFIESLRKESKVSAKIIKLVLANMHKHLYHDIIHDIVSIILSQTSVRDKNDICARDYGDKITKNVIRSKNNKNTQQLQQLCMVLLDKIFNDVLRRDIRNYSVNNQIQLRKIIIRGIVYNLRKNICKSMT